MKEAISNIKNKKAYITIAAAGVGLGISGVLIQNWGGISSSGNLLFSLLPLMLLLIPAALALAGSIFADMEKAIAILAFYSVIDYIFRQFVKINFLSGYWDELLLMACFLIWLTRWAFIAGTQKYIPTPLDGPIIIFFGIGILLLILRSPELSVAIEGFRAVFEYIIWFFAANVLLKTSKGARRFYTLLILTGALVAFIGLIQYAAGVENPSNWADQAEKGVRRVFSIIGSPNILGSFMTLLTPMAIALALSKTNLFKKLFFTGIAAAMGLCLLLTFSRGAWIGFAAAIIIFIFMKDKRFIFPIIIVSLLLIIFVPSIQSRIAYMLSSDYIASSMRAGRLARWPAGLKMWFENFWFGVGLGRFGGAVAQNNKISGNFYMDNYYLKTAVEMGIVGISGFIILILSTIKWSFRAIKKAADTTSRLMLQGAFAGMCGVIIHNFFENVFEVPYMLAYFWLIAGFIMFTARQQPSSDPPLTEH
ncbi:MAG: O-antigen ligase family protein [Clostridiales bacterium]|nr:O-antigen ligase family protein [Clostridiales bacterium]